MLKKSLYITDTSDFFKMVESRKRAKVFILRNDSCSYANYTICYKGTTITSVKQVLGMS